MQRRVFNRVRHFQPDKYLCSHLPSPKSSSRLVSAEHHGVTFHEHRGAEIILVKVSEASDWACNPLRHHLVPRYFSGEAFKLVCLVFWRHWLGLGKGEEALCWRILISNK